MSKKHVGSRFTYQDLFEEDLMNNYRRICKEHLDRYGRICTTTVMRELVNSPARRFYTTEERARDIVNGIAAGRTYPKMKGMTREMYLEIYSRFLPLRRARPDASTIELVCEICDQPAPRFYLTPASAAVKLCKIRTRERRRRS